VNRGERAGGGGGGGIFCALSCKVQGTKRHRYRGARG
jgi:hypothetical protein